MPGDRAVLPSDVGLERVPVRTRRRHGQARKVGDRAPLTVGDERLRPLRDRNQRRYDDAIEWANKALALDPHHLLARELLAGAYLKKGDFDRYLAQLADHVRVVGEPLEALEPLKAAYGAGGRTGFWNYSLEQMANNQNVPAFQLAVFSAEAGEIDAAFLHLDRAILCRDPALVDLAVAPQWDSLRDDPRFMHCLERMGLLPADSRQFEA